MFLTYFRLEIKILLWNMNLLINFYVIQKIALLVKKYRNFTFESKVHINHHQQFFSDFLQNALRKPLLKWLDSLSFAIVSFLMLLINFSMQVRNNLSIVEVNYQRGTLDDLLCLVTKAHCSTYSFSILWYQKRKEKMSIRNLHVFHGL